MENRFKVLSACFLILTKKQNDKELILLHKRSNTGSLDGTYDLCVSGHLKQGETTKECMIRESFEEIGIRIRKDHLQFHGSYNVKFNNQQYVSSLFVVDTYEGIPFVKEANKSAALNWFEVSHLPENLAKHAKVMINDYLENVHYNEIGFQEEFDDQHHA